MTAWTDFHFLRPWWLLALPVIAGALWLLQRRRLARGDWAAVCDSWLLPHVLMDRPGRRQRHGLALLGLGGLLGSLALAGPTWERLPAPAFRNEQALVILLDLSRSMDAADVKPSRLERARYKMLDLLQARKDGQTALVAYAGDAFTVSPLTDDAETIRAQLNSLSTAIMPVQGSRADVALRLGGELLRQAGLREGHVLLISDGVTGESARHAAEQLHSQGYAVSVLGVGTEVGAPVALPGGGFLKDAEGAIVVPKLDERSLQDLAAAGGGRYLPVAQDGGDVRVLAGLFQQHAGQGDGAGQARLEQWQDLGPWLLLPVLPLAALAFRRGLLALWLVTLLPWPDPAAAWEWRDLWHTPNQQGQQAMDAGRYGEAAERFRDPAWKGVAYYRDGQYQKAAEALAGLDDVESLYNRGNALAQAGRYQEAIAAYAEVLRRQPGHGDARHNKELLEQRLRQQQSGQNAGPQEQPSDERQAGVNDDASQGQGQKGAERGDGRPSGADGEDGPSKAEAAKAGQEEAAKAGEAPSSPQPQAAGAEPENAAGSKTGIAEESRRIDETQQANEAWLKRIPDDPGGLLRRKFQYQYQQRRHAPGGGEEAW